VNQFTNIFQQLVKWIAFGNYFVKPIGNGAL
jgi:hypothetical protein